MLKSTLCKTVLGIWQKHIFFCHDNFRKIGHSKWSKNEPENIPKIKDNLFIKGFKRLKTIDFWYKVTGELAKSLFWHLFKPKEG